jgi:hypothetical protein
VSNVNKWEKDETTLLPNGIRKSDSCSYSQSVKIFDKILTDILSIHDVPVDFYNFFFEKGYTSRSKKLVDYLYKTPISWNLFKQNNLLYETNLQKIMPFVLDGPNSQGLPLEAPGNIGSWIGWQIVKSYCKKNTPKNHIQLMPSSERKTTMLPCASLRLRQVSEIGLKLTLR